MDTKDIKIKAVVAGVLIDIVGSTIIGVLLGVLVVATSGGASAAQLAVLKDNIYVSVLGLLGSTLSTGLGGYVAARLSLPEGMINALTVGVISLLLGIVLAVFVSDLTSGWKLLAGFILTIPAAYVGGKIATRGSS